MLAIAHIEQRAQEVTINILHEITHGFYLCEDVRNGSTYTIYRHNIVLMNNERIPYRFALENFQRVAPHIGEALKRYPEPAEINTPLSATTMARLLQEAVTAKERYGHRHPTINESQWDLHHSELTTSIKGAHVVLLGPRKAVREAKPTGEVAAVVPEYEIASDHLEVLVHLLAQKAIKNPPRFFVLDPPGPVVAKVEEMYDIAIVPDGQNTGKYYIA